MTMASRLVGAVVVGVLAATALTACTSGGPAESPTVAAPAPASASPRPTPSATPTPVPIVAGQIIVSSTTLRVESTTGAVMAEIPFTTDPATALAQFTDAIAAAPTVSTVPESDCQPAATFNDWGGLRLTTPSYYPTLGGGTFWVSAKSVSTPNGIPIVIAGTGGVGTPLATLLADEPGIRDTWAADNDRYLVDPQEGDRWGVAVQIVDSAVHDFSSQTFYNPHQGC